MLSKKVKKNIGRKIGRWTVISHAPKLSRRDLYLCICECGTKRLVSIGRLNYGGSKSCGCFSREVTKKLMFKHGMTKQRFHRIWAGMKNRCSNPKNACFPKYGGRGIKVCNRWKNFINFKDDMYKSYLAHVDKHGEKNTSLNRLEGDKGYSPKNCQWATSKEQTFNRSLKFRTRLRDYEIKAIVFLKKKYNIPQKEINALFGLKDFKNIKRFGRHEN